MFIEEQLAKGSISKLNDRIGKKNQCMPTSTVENYLKQILLEQEELGSIPVPMGRVASALGVVPGTITTMMKALADSQLVDYEPRVGVRLTVEGKKLALCVLRRHRLIELFLVETLGLDWSEIHEEAEKLEHVISDRVLERIDTLLGHPTADPHGDPIPSAKGILKVRDLESLDRCALNRSVRIARITDQTSAFLQFIESSGLTPGVEVSVTHRNPLADVITLHFSRGATLTLGSTAAEKILVE